MDQCKEKEDKKKVRKICDHLTKFQSSLAWKLAQSNGLGDHTNPEIIEQMKRKHPTHKKEITPLTDEELSRPRKGIDKAVFKKTIQALKHDMAPGLGNTY